MKKSIFFLFFFFCLILAQGQNLKVLLGHKAYCTDKMNSYIEFSFFFFGQTAEYALNEHGKYEANIEITVDIKQQDSIINSLKYILVSDSYEDTIKANKLDFTDVKNLAVDNGEYYLYYSIKDLNSTDPAIQYIDMINVNYPIDKISTSKILLFQELKPAESGEIFTKYGFSGTPVFHSYISESVMTLPFILEIYNTENIIGKGKKIQIKSYIEFLETNFLAIPNDIITTEKSTAPILVYTSRFNIFNLPSGNYNLVVEIRSEDNDSLMAIEKIFFQRSNPTINLDINNYNQIDISNSFVAQITDTALLRDYVSCLYPIASTVEQEFFDKQMKKIPFEQLQRYFYSFWISRSTNNPEAYWKAYKEKVDYVQNTYGSKLVKGYRTDRGRVYLKYGAPSNIVEVPYDPNAYPYEIWHYYYIVDQSNVKFVFYSRDNVSNDYELLHSDKYGELSNPRWQLDLTNRFNPDINPDATKSPNYWGNSMEEDWKFGR